jgi:5'-nucleotidase
MRILVTNDDGIFSPGLVTLADLARAYGEVRVVAPDVEQSAMGHAVTIQRPLQVHPTHLNDLEAYRVNGTPADCVALGLYRWDGADLVLSGINLGSNLGHEVWHSGTVAAAKQAALLGVRAAAFSLVLTNDAATLLPDFVDKAIRLLLENDGPPLVNVNLPAFPRGLLWTHQSVRSYGGRVVPGKDPMGREHFWFAPSPLSDPEPGSDRWAVENGLVSLTPLRLDLTDEAELTRQFQNDVGEPLADRERPSRGGPSGLPRRPVSPVG